MDRKTERQVHRSEKGGLTESWELALIWWEEGTATSVYWQRSLCFPCKTLLLGDLHFLTAPWVSASDLVIPRVL